MGLAAPDHLRDRGGRGAGEDAREADAAGAATQSQEQLHVDEGDSGQPQLKEHAPPAEEQSRPQNKAPPLTASFERVPAEHGGEV